MITQKASARARPLDYFMLFEPHPDGPVLGTYAGHPIAETVIDGYGIRYIFAGVAPRLRSGGYDSEALLPGEWLVEPGLVYRQRSTPADHPLKKWLGLAK
jgi:hypothetical protein